MAAGGHGEYCLHVRLVSHVACARCIRASTAPYAASTGSLSGCRAASLIAHDDVLRPSQVLGRPRCTLVSAVHKHGCGQLVCAQAKYKAHIKRGCLSAGAYMTRLAICAVLCRAVIANHPRCFALLLSAAAPPRCRGSGSPLTSARPAAAARQRGRAPNPAPPLLCKHPMG